MQTINILAYKSVTFTSFVSISTDGSPIDIGSNDFTLALKDARDNEISNGAFSDIPGDSKKVGVDLTSNFPANFTGTCKGLLIWVNPANFEVITLCQIKIDVVDDAHVNSSTTHYLANNSTLNINAAQAQNNIQIAITSGLQGPQGDEGKPGDEGPEGPQGPQGPQGVYVQPTVITLTGTGEISINTSTITNVQTLILNNAGVGITVRFINNDGSSIAQNLTTPVASKATLLVFRDGTKIYYH